jgi:hypothetical protein
VSSVEDSRVYWNQLKYLIRLTAYDSLTWEPPKVVDGLQGVEEFRQRYPQKPGPLVNVLGGPRTCGGDTLTALDDTKIRGIKGGSLERELKELDYGKAETLGDVEEAV